MSGPAPSSTVSTMPAGVPTAGANVISVGGKTYDMEAAANANIKLQPEGTMSDEQTQYYLTRVLDAIIRDNNLRNVTESTKTQILYAVLLDHALVGTSSNRQFDNTVKVGNQVLKLQGLKTAYNGMCRRFARTYYPLVIQLLLLPSNDEIAIDILRKGGMNETHKLSIGALLDFAPAQKMDTVAEQTKRLTTFDYNVYDSVDPYAALRSGSEQRVAPGQLPVSAGGLTRGGPL